MHTSVHVQLQLCSRRDPYFTYNFAILPQQHASDLQPRHTHCSMGETACVVVHTQSSTPAR